MTGPELPPIDSFSGEYRFLSNFYVFPLWIPDVSLWAPTVEHGYQAGKTLDPDLRRRILVSGSPSLAKRLGRAVPLRNDWEQIKEAVMLDLLRRKFWTPVFADRLLGTGNRLLAEGNTWGDTYWGVCGGLGHNRLGVLLMRVRDELAAHYTRYGREYLL